MPAKPRIAILVPAPGYDEPWLWTFDPQAEALRNAGALVDAIPWTMPVDATAYDLLLPLVAWGYHSDFGRWCQLLDRAAAEKWPMINPPTLLRWNSDKAYLVELASKGVPTVPTVISNDFRDGDLTRAREVFDCEWLVIKPPISASAVGTHRIGPADLLPEESRGRVMIVQPMIEEIGRSGEYSLMFFDGEFSHAVVKRPKAGDFRVQEYLGGTSEAAAPPDGAVDLAHQALEAAPGHSTYARVDMIRDDAGTLRIMELELIEPSLFLHCSKDAPARFARAILSAAERASE